MRKKIEVKPYVRGGKPVAGYQRSTGVTAAKSEDVHGPTADVKSLLGDDCVDSQVLVGKHYQGWAFSSGEELRGYRRFENCTFEKTSFANMEMGDVEFVNCVFDKCRFDKVSMMDAQFEHCTFDQVGFYGKDGDGVWENVGFVDCGFTDGLWYGAGVKKGTINGCTFTDVEIGNVSRLQHMEITSSTFVDSRFDSTDLAGSVFDKCEFTNTRFSYVGRYELASWPNGLYRIMDDTPASFHVRDSKLLDCAIGGSDLTGMAFTGNTVTGLKINRCKAHGMNFYGSQGNSVKIFECDMSGANFDAVTLRDLEFNGTISLKDTSWVQANPDVEFVKRPQESYRQYSFDDALAASGLSEKRFEFMVLSGVIEIRDNGTLDKVTSGFDPDKHHVPPWVFENLGRVAAVTDDPA